MPSLLADDEPAGPVCVCPLFNNASLYESGIGAEHQHLRHASQRWVNLKFTSSAILTSPRHLEG